jgi:hypothetical protein
VYVGEDGPEVTTPDPQHEITSRCCRAQRWIEFMERADDLNNAHGEVAFDITGPWPPYDFVRITV